LLCLFLAIDRRDPEMLLRGPDDILPVGRNLEVFAAFLVAANVTEQSRLTTAHIYRPRLLLRHFCLACRICRRAFFVRLAAARVNDRFAIRRQLHARDRLAIVAFVMRDLSRYEIRRVCHPDVTLALVVEGPRDARRMRRAR
jgi:hypothetical protein